MCMPSLNSLNSLKVWEVEGGRPKSLTQLSKSILIQDENELSVESFLKEGSTHGVVPLWGTLWITLIGMQIVEPKVGKKRRARWNYCIQTASYSSNIKAFKYHATQKLLFEVNLTLKLASKILYWCVWSFLRWIGHNHIGGQFFMLDGWEVRSCICNDFLLAKMMTSLLGASFVGYNMSLISPFDNMK